MVPPLFLAVEVIATTDHASVLDMVHKAPKISADETRREMKRRIQPQDCDDIIVQDESLSISLRDPFSSILFRTPVKGLYCRHIECFDLETWLQTRRGKPSQSRTEPSLADGWKCPVCDEDARPPNLRIDEFLSEVREALVKTGTDGARRIKAQLDGTWTVEEEVNENDESNAEAAAAQTDESNQSIEVIEID
ncbi:hypothetical protein UVI_02041640 [Ustilaginoidea virens]|nr:hypothetical protein UVI_02041640 [Ustilaginoidea virens]